MGVQGVRNVPRATQRNDRATRPLARAPQLGYGWAMQSQTLARFGVLLVAIGLVACAEGSDLTAVGPTSGTESSGDGGAGQGGRSGDGGDRRSDSSSDSSSDGDTTTSPSSGPTGVTSVTSTSAAGTSASSTTSATSTSAATTSSAQSAAATTASVTQAASTGTGEAECDDGELPCGPDICCYDPTNSGAPLCCTEDFECGLDGGPFGCQVIF